MELKEMEKLIQQIPKEQLRQFQKTTQEIKKRTKKLQKTYFKQYTEIEDMLFSFEDLPYLGKEYWFLYFAPTQPNSKQQLLLSFGGANLDDVPILPADKEITKKKTKFISWAYTDKKTDIKNAQIMLSIKKGKTNQIQAKSKDFETTLKGKYPNYKFTIKKQGKIICNLKLTKPKKYMPFELKQFFVGPTGLAFENIFFDYTGTLYGKPFKGLGYVQKVVALIPFAPWHWVRTTFSNGSVFDMFTPKAEAFGKTLALTPLTIFFDAKTKKYHKLKNVQIQPYLDGKKWVIHNDKLFMTIEPYEQKEYVLQTKTKFHYTQKLVKVTDFQLDLGKGYKLSELGTGIGLLEDAYGFMV